MRERAPLTNIITCNEALSCLSTCPKVGPIVCMLVGILRCHMIHCKSPLLIIHFLSTYFDQFEGDHDIVACLFGLEDVGELALACTGENVVTRGRDSSVSREAIVCDIGDGGSNEVKEQLSEV